jgi:hypothetical protein
MEQQAKRKGSPTRRRSKRLRKAKAVTEDPSGAKQTAEIWDRFEIQPSKLEPNLRYFLAGRTGRGVFLKKDQPCTFDPLPWQGPETKRVLRAELTVRQLPYVLEDADDEDYCLVSSASSLASGEVDIFWRIQHSSHPTHRLLHNPHTDSMNCTALSKIDSGTEISFGYGSDYQKRAKEFWGNK